MLIHPWDAAVEADEWQQWLASTDRFGVLAVNNLDPTEAPVLVPTHFTVAGGELLVHLARPNPVWPHLEAAAEVRLAVIGDYAYIPTYWRAKAGGPDEDGVPTSYYAAVQFVCRPEVIDDPAAKAEILTAQMADMQPEGRHEDVAVSDGPYARMLPGIRGIRLEVLSLEAKFKFDDQKPLEYRERVSHQLDERGQGLDASAAAQQRRRLDSAGDWQTRRPNSRPTQGNGGEGRFRVHGR
jgi:transcriptional regulator